MHSDEQAEQLEDELLGRIYTALRDGGLDAEPLLGLAFLLEEWGEGTPATRELLERPTAQLTPADLTRLGETLLREAGFQPGFTLEPRLWTTLEQALEVVKRDVRTGGVAGTLRLITHDWDSRARAWAEFRGGYHGNGIDAIAGSNVQWALGEVAEAVQETIMGMTMKVWPVCAAHNRGLYAGYEHETAIWRCTGGGTHIVAPVGELP
ncbi:hypothetical protein HTZ77_13110 [Nonomuraea sp. SMC257]|uniref:Uncharacterized protein n=1 Tax=Nonomuraea montanisoli TaxID=2741721 RepID=A0A7Y6I732_9ACTN|nr:hypothetical protein [Nonomuraea montanisoli]NUW32363.1 hypothetical protein [Nonomuraea montanisoli]